MIRIFLTFITIFSVASGTATEYAPNTRRGNVVDTIHGHKIADPYRWLENQESPEVRAWLARQDAWFKQHTNKLPLLKDINTRLTALKAEGFNAAPTRIGNRYFYQARKKGKDKYGFYMREGLNGPEQIVPDPDALHESERYLYMIISPKANYLLYAKSKNGEDERTPYVLDMKTRKILPDQFISGRFYRMEWTPDEEGFYYSFTDQEKRGRSYFHKVGSDQAQDRIVFGKDALPNHWAGTLLSPNARHLVILTGEGTSGHIKIYYKKRESNEPAKPILTDIKAHFEIAFAGERLLILTDWKAPNYRVISLDLNDLSNPDASSEFIPEKEDPISSLFAFGGKIFVTYLKNVRSSVEIYSPDGVFEKELEAPPYSIIRYFTGTWDDEEVYYTASSFKAPFSVHQWNATTDKHTKWFSPPIPFDSDQLVVDQKWTKSKDGTAVPFFIMHHKDIKPNGDLPTNIHGYGGFNASLLPAFNPTAAVWTEMGGIYVVANIRGGNEFGKAWHQAAMFDKKQNSFDDFIAVIEELIRSGYTNPDRVVISGSSNGGLLTGAVMTQRPDLIKAVDCRVPLLDMIRFHKFMLGGYWTSEYGSPEDPEAFKWLYAYSPYHRVKKGTAYPAAIFTSGDSDTRVAPLHARKMTAMLQWAQNSQTGKGPILLNYSQDEGHLGTGSLKKNTDSEALILTFLANQVGIKSLNFSETKP